MLRQGLEPCSCHLQDRGSWRCAEPVARRPGAERSRTTSWRPKGSSTGVSRSSRPLSSKASPRTAGPSTSCRPCPASMPRRGLDPRRDRSRHERLRLRPCLHRLGRTVARLRRERRQAALRRNPQGLQAPAGHPGRGRPCRNPHQPLPVPRLQARHRRPRRGHKRAIVATAHKMARALHVMLRDATPYRTPAPTTRPCWSTATPRAGCASPAGSASSRRTGREPCGSTGAP